MTTPGPLSPVEAKRKIQEIAQVGNVITTRHCREESMPDAHVDMNDVLHVLKTGEIKRDPEWDDENQVWKYRVEGYALDKDELTVITVIVEKEYYLRIVTVF